MAANPLPISEEGALKHDVDKRAKDIVGYCEDLFAEAKAGKEPFTRDWDVFFDMLIGKQWGPTPARREPTVENRIFRIIQHMVALQTDTKPAVEVTARPQERDMEKLMRFGITDQTLGDQAELLKKAVLSIWDDMDVDIAVLTGLLNGETFGRGLWKVVYNPFVNFCQPSSLNASASPIQIGFRISIAALNSALKILFNISWSGFNALISPCVQYTPGMIYAGHDTSGYSPSQKGDGLSCINWSPAMVISRFPPGYNISPG